MAENKVTVTFPKRLRHLDFKEASTKELYDYVKYMVEQSEQKIRSLERRIKELESK